MKLNTINLNSCPYATIARNVYMIQLNWTQRDKEAVSILLKKCITTIRNTRKTI